MLVLIKNKQSDREIKAKSMDYECGRVAFALK